MSMLRSTIRHHRPSQGAAAQPWARLALSLLPVLCFAGCRPRELGPNDIEKAAMAALQDEYEPQEQKLDDKGRVIKLKLDGPHVDDAALEQVASFKYLRELSLARATVTDAGLLKLQPLKRLESLGLTETRVTDKGLLYLQKMPSLRNLWVTEGRGVTAAGIESLKKALPGLTVYVPNRQPPPSKEPSKEKEKEKEDENSKSGDKSK
jgi:hypothetical protein